ncbi:hypothetical protein CH306_26685 [Rhodococcus sp. 15-725-2-2b]|uniref:class I adenylate-forming enzyme family protein n=1 Tax=unclassified Rhodococcus (in: high G+C Gram-positive bacteria) TaxID=192944 RepID=UPI000B9BC610|nr:MULTISPECIES: AMP-binding protein [unclassified Rhodococcus (in: high G+C Gram-positive bacteria)]OZC63537.1 hypothetical protein CH277_21975 [Rhodococcus sp. 06-469-3-2]OZD40702.1 hypothetical protein CH264_23660 [Rhodococcus sp. 06-1477-1A]OZE67190.1 hypothetical protein CH306_26685 [Rhodococcus sp. 15-725-2-2b]
MDIPFFLRHAFGDISRFDPDRPVLALEDEIPLTLRELADRTDTYARGLQRLGVGTGDRVGILLYNSIEYWIAYFATVRLGAIAVRLNFRLRTDEIKYALDDSGTTVLLSEPELLHEIEPIRDDVGVRHYLSAPSDHARPEWAEPWSVLDDGTNEPLDAPRPSDDTPAMLMYTSGTTGRPKGVLWNHGNTTWWVAMQLMEWKFDQDSVTMITGPLYHIGGIENYTLPTIAAGGKAIILRSKNFDLERTLRIAAKTKTTDLLLFPSMINQMLELTNLADIDLSSLRRIFTGGDALMPAACDRLTALLPDADLVQLYGLTEGTPIAVCGAPGFAKERPDSVGRAYPFTEVSVRDDDGVPVEPGTVGEIWTRSPANSVGYWNKPEETAATFVDGWCKTGDLGIVETGALRIAGRKKDMIRSGGENISPAEIENVLIQHPDIVDAAVVGIPDPTYVEAVCAVVVTTPTSNLTENDVVAFCTTRLAGYKKPRKVVFLPELPRTASQKIQKFKLRRDLSDPNLARTT